MLTVIKQSEGKEDRLFFPMKKVKERGKSAGDRVRARAKRVTVDASSARDTKDGMTIREQDWFETLARRQERTLNYPVLCPLYLRTIFDLSVYGPSEEGRPWPGKAMFV
ncbi:uncharacterized protein SPSK_10478 [Sporothrix schenckii 1099-18]|uniref:Uncharacterized protein n=1 Tax=Sporothrix schenckii 1099-18 TaxID=1397361 RepID=A0A0F2MBW2_SPOSC|nr:uncharacterized protein SPSK_10478 [Sporothrix schenckii 1099-18]KJR86554.1 hypothetical protein SPSK_10478 [Sporothrix schenckii 1099-18]